MNLLLDTHVFIWWTISPNRLSEKVSELIANPKNILFLSLVSIWEIQIKSQLGKLTFDLPLADLIKRQQEVNALYLLPIEVTHIYNLASLPNHHRDPFDRLLMAQALVEKINLISIDKVFDQYPVDRIW
ncbi:MAG: type II toxin-antitoxin system VapC family toxin [Xenococcus sp. (in: cyanobacteria)]